MHSIYKVQLLLLNPKEKINILDGRKVCDFDFYYLKPQNLSKVLPENIYFWNSEVTDPVQDEYTFANQTREIYVLG